MSGKAFLDTNILIYFYSDKEPDKRESACQILEQYDCISSLQIFNEVSNVWFKKFGWDSDKIIKHLDNIELVCDNVLTVERSTINKAIKLKDLYRFSYYDSLMLASALEGKCSIVFSEDMNDGQIIEKVLKITNPFKNV
jgi:predicted nucleic acid-binding protein